LGPPRLFAIAPRGGCCSLCGLPNRPNENNGVETRRCYSTKLPRNRNTERTPDISATVRWHDVPFPSAANFRGTRSRLTAIPSTHARPPTSRSGPPICRRTAYGQWSETVGISRSRRPAIATAPFIRAYGYAPQVMRLRLCASGYAPRVKAQSIHRLTRPPPRLLPVTPRRLYGAPLKMDFAASWPLRIAGPIPSHKSRVARPAASPVTKALPMRAGPRRPHT
jgi:hypothetical protein